MPWLKVLVSDANDGRLAKAKGDAVLVLFAARCQHATHGHGGVIPPGRLDPSRLRDEARGFLASVTEGRIAAALIVLERLKLLAPLQDGSWRLCDYQAEVMPSCMRCRNANEDHRYANCPRCRKLQAAQLHEKRERQRQESRDVTRDSARVTQRDRTGPEDGRKEGFSSDSVPEESTEVGSTPVPEPQERARIARSKLESLNRKFRLGGSNGPA